MITSSRIINGIVSNNLSCSPNHNAKPLDSNPSAIAIPPPNNNNIPQGSFTASFQPKSDSFLFLLGSINKTTAEIIAIIVSSIDGII